MTFPLWAVLSLAAACVSTTTMILQERFKLDGFTLAFWNKVGTVIIVTPLVLAHDIPASPMFYALLCASAAIYAVSDIVYFSAISKVGAGAVSRILPASVIFSFIVWLLVDPASLQKYMAAPELTAAIFGVLCLWAYFASHLRKCEVSMKAARIVWFVVFAAIVGPAVDKKVLGHAGADGSYTFVFVQALLMLSIWGVVAVLRKPVPASVLFARDTWQRGIGIGFLSGIYTLFLVQAIYHADVPAYPVAVSFLNVLLILAVYKVMKRKNDGNLVAGIGMVLCATALILLQGFIQ